MKIPIRLYNHVAVGRSPSPYDLLWPVARRREQPAECAVDEVAVIAPAAPTKAPRPSGSRNGGALDDFARRLLAVRDRGQLGAVELSVGQVPVSEDSPRQASSGAGVPGGCKEAVEIATRNPKKRASPV